MTREEAIEYFKMKVFAREAIGNDIGADYEAYKIALTALRPVSRDQVEKVWRGEWKPIERLWKYSHQWQCSRCGQPTLTDQKQFCDFCGAPMTDEAVKMVMERLEALKDGKDD